MLSVPSGAPVAISALPYSLVRTTLPWRISNTEAPGSRPDEIRLLMLESSSAKRCEENPTLSGVTIGSSAAGSAMTAVLAPPSTRLRASAGGAARAGGGRGGGGGGTGGGGER